MGGGGGARGQRLTSEDKVTGGKKEGENWRAVPPSTCDQVALKPLPLMEPSVRILTNMVLPAAGTLCTVV